MREDWKYSTIGESCNINYGTRVVRKRDGGTIYDVYGGGGATFKMDTYNRENCLVVSRFAMSPKCTRFVSGKFFLNDSGLTLSPKEDSGLSEVFMNTILLANNDNIYKYGRGSAQRNLKVDEFCTMPISYPKSLSEQERIVALLDDQFAKIDALKANAASQLQAAKDLFQSALKEMLTPKEGWEEKKIGDICEVTDFVANGSFATLRENVKYHNEPNYAVLVRLADYSSNFDKSKFVYVDKHSYDFLSKSRLNGGEIIMSNVGSIGKCFICPDLGMPMTIGPNSLLVKTPYSQFFIYYFKNITFQEKLKTITNQTTLSKFNKTQFRELTILIPSLPEQERIAARLDAISEKVKALQDNYDQTITLCNDLKQALLKSIFA